MNPTVSTELPDLDLDRLEALARAATPGEWLHRIDTGNYGAQHCIKLAGEHGEWVCDCIDNADVKTEGGIAGERNAAFIAAANPAAVLALIALARRPPVPALRPTDDELWDSTIRDRDTYQEWADKLAAAIAIHFGVDIGEHSNANCPWHEALEAILSAPDRPEGEAPQAEPAMWVQYIDGVKTQNVARDAKEKASVESIHRVMAPGTTMTWRALYDHAPAAQHAESGAQADRIKELESLVGVAEAELRSMDRDLAAARAALAAQSQGAQAARIDVKHEFERWASQRGESAVYIGDGLYRSRTVTDMAEAFAGGVEVARAAFNAAKAEAPAHETIVQQADELVCTACGTSAQQAAAPGALDERAAFEHAERASDLSRSEGYEDAYANPCVQSAWEGWQARASLICAPSAPGTPEAPADARKAALEEAAAIAEKIADDYSEKQGGKWPELRDDAATGAGDCASAIRERAAQLDGGQESFGATERMSQACAKSEPSGRLDGGQGEDK